jgi:hypothetical protein
LQLALTLLLDILPVAPTRVVFVPTLSLKLLLLLTVVLLIVAVSPPLIA